MVGLGRTDSCTPCAAGEYSEEAAARCALAFILGCRIGFRVQDLEVLGGGGVLFCVSVWVYSEVSSRFEFYGARQDHSDPSGFLRVLRFAKSTQIWQAMARRRRRSRRIGWCLGRSVFTTAKQQP